MARTLQLRFREFGAPIIYMIPVPQLTLIHILPLPGADIISKLSADGLLWRHRHMGQPLAIVTSQWPIVPTCIYGRMMLRSARVEGIAITCEALSCLVHDFITLHIVVEWFITAHWETKQFIHVFGLICLFTLLIIFELPCFNTGHR